MKKPSQRKRVVPNVVKGKPLNYNAGIMVKYERDLTRLVRYMTAETHRELRKLFTDTTAHKFFAQDASVSSDAKILMNKLYSKFNRLFAFSAKKLAEGMVDETGKVSDGNLKSSLRDISQNVTLPTDVISGAVKEVVKASIAENVSLIKSISQEYLSKVEGAVMRSITTGNGLQTLVPYLQKHAGATEKRARFIAEDQTRKAYNSINKARLQSLGMKRFEWLHTAGSMHPRPLHIELSGQIFSFDNLPVIDDKTGERGIPGQLPNCRCRMVPVLEFTEEGE